MKSKTPINVKVPSSLLCQTRPVGVSELGGTPSDPGRFNAHLHTMRMSREGKMDFRGMFFDDFLPMRWIMRQQNLKVLLVDPPKGFLQITFGFEANAPVFNSEKLDFRAIFFDRHMLVQEQPISHF